MIRPLLLAITVSAAATACTPVGMAPVGYYGYDGTATVVTPDLVSVGPGVQVIADYDEPIFYADNFYWRNYGGSWYRSRMHTGGWAYAAPPRAVLGINHGAYVRYRPNGYVSRRGYNGGYNRPAVRDYRGGYNRGPAVRDYRGDRRGSYNRAPVVRDTRGPRAAPPRSVVRSNDRGSRPAPTRARHDRRR